MKRYYILLTVILSIYLSACKNSANQVEIKGEITGLKADSIYLYGNDELSDFFLPIYVEDEEFSLTVDMDTLSQAMLFIDDTIQYPVYLEKGKTIQIKGDKNTGIFEVKGNAPNEELTAFNQTLIGLHSESEKRQAAETYIQENQTSLINIYLLDKYFVQVPAPDFKKIKELIRIMHGTLQDKPYTEALTKLIEENEMSAVHKTGPLFSISNREGKKISRSEFRDKYLLITFWASWCDTCRASNKEIREIYKTYFPKKRKGTGNRTSQPNKEETFAIVGISLDLNKTEWLEAIRRDTLQWEQACDFTGWNNNIVQQYNVRQLPYNILLDKRGQIIARDIKGEELNKKLKELLNAK